MPSQEELIRQALEKIERARDRQGISIRRAAERAPKISEGYWRQLVAGGTSQSGVWIPRLATVDQVLKMASAVGIADEIATDLGISTPQQTMYTGGFELGQNLTNETLAAILRSISNQMLLTELARRLNVTKP